MKSSRPIVHLSVGREDWTPTTEELFQVVKNFQLASLDPAGGVVATCDGVKVEYLEIPDGASFVVNGQVVGYASYLSDPERIIRLLEIRKSLFMWNMNLTDVDELLKDAGYERLDDLPHYVPQ
jgi:hypothetical protein